METNKTAKIFLLTTLLLILTSLPNQQIISAEQSRIDLFSSNKDSSISQIDIAHSSINITLTEDNFKYLRHTHVTDVDYAEEWLLNSFTVVDLTTHGDLFVQFHMEYNASSWNNNITEFRLSPLVDDFRSDYKALNELGSLNTSLLGIISKSFETNNFTREDFENPLETEQIFIIDQKFVIRETVGFILSINELFRFDLNSIQLGAMSDFHMEIFSSGETDISFFEEKIRIQAPGSPLIYVQSTKGYSGIILFSEFEPQRVEKFFRPGIMSDQEIDLSIKLPREQHVSADPYFGDNEGDDTLNEALDFRVRKNEISLHVASGDWLPSKIIFKSEIPLLNQFSFTDYGSMAIAVFTGGFAVLRGLPFIVRQRKYNSFKKKVFSEVQVNDPSSIQAQQEVVKKKFMKQKISAKQYEDIVHELDVFEDAANDKKSSVVAEKAQPETIIENNSETFP